MQISVRSPIAIGVAAFTGAAAVAMTPSLATAPVPSLARVTDAVTMAALANPSRSEKCQDSRLRIKDLECTFLFRKMVNCISLNVT